MEKQVAPLQPVTVPDYMKIRKYVITLINRGSAAPAMLPPMAELATQFGVTRMTVHKALKDLIRDHYLISRKGVGTFINPSRIINANLPTRQLQIALVVGEGKHCFYDDFYWEHIAAMGKEITSQGHMVNLVNLLTVKPEEMVKELRSNLVEGVIWIDPFGAAEDVLRTLQKEKFPAVSLHKYIDGVNSVGMDYAAHAVEIGRAMLAENRRNLIFIGQPEVQAVQLQLNALREVYAASGISLNERHLLLAPERLREELGTILDFGVDVQALYVAGQYLSVVLPILQEKFQDFARKCRIICEPFYDPGQNSVQKYAWIREYRFASEAQKAVEILKRMVGEQNFQIETIQLPFGLRKDGDARSAAAR